MKRLKSFRLPAQLSLFRALFFWQSPPAKKAKAGQVEQKNSSPQEQDAQLKEIWLNLRREYFPQRAELDSYTVQWSRRAQKRTLGSCSVQKRKVVIARELSSEKCRLWLRPVLYHEMCHAYLGKNVTQENGKRAWHGKEFKLLEKRCPEINSLNRWLKSGGWLSAVRSDRTRRAHARRKAASE